MIWERTGTISVTAGSAVVNGTGTAWATPTVKPGYILMTADLKMYEVETVNSGTQITLSENYAGATNGSTTYVIIPTAGANVDLHARIEAFFDRTRDLVNGGTDLLTATEAAYDAKLLEWEGEFDTAQSQRATDFTAAQDALASQFASDRAQQDLDIANAMNGLEGAPIAKAIPSGAIGICNVNPWATPGDHFAWMLDGSKSWAKEDRVTTTYLGVYANEAAARAVAGAADGDWYWNDTDKKCYELNAGSGQTERYRFGAAHFDARFAVAFSDRVVLVDGDGVPWMVFKENGSSLNTFWYNGRDASCVEMMGSHLFIGSDGDTWGGLRVCDFAADNLSRRSNAGFYSGRKVSDRNINLALPTVSTDTSQRLVHHAINAVAATVLPNAPADPVTGLPVPTIGVVHDGGAQVLMDDGSIATLFSTYAMQDISFGPDGAAVFTSAGDGNLRTMPYPYTGSAASIATGYGNFGVPSLSASSSWRGALWSKLLPNGRLVAQASGSGDVPMATVFDNPSDRSKSMVAYQAPDYVTPPMFGDVKTALLCERGAASLVGAELVTNGTFDTDSDWTKETGWSIGSGVATCASGSTNLYQNAGLVSGQAYVVTFEITSHTSGSVNVGSGSAVGTNRSGVGAYTEFLTATNSSNLVISSNSFVGSIDNVSVRLATPDRSVSGKGAVIHGTLLREQTSSKFGVRPIDSSSFAARDFAGLFNGQSEFYIAFAAHGAAYGTNLFTWHETVGGGTSAAYLQAYTDGSTGEPRIVWQNRQALTAAGQLSSIEGRWSQILIQFSGGSCSVYQDGELRATSTTGITADLHELRAGGIGAHVADVVVGPGAPSSAQIRIMSNWKGDVIEGTILDTDYVESTQGLWVLTSAYCYEIGPDGAERSKQVNDIGATTLVAFRNGRLVS